jgi:hypothetical protein
MTHPLLRNTHNLAVIRLERNPFYRRWELPSI